MSKVVVVSLLVGLSLFTALPAVAAPLQPLSEFLCATQEAAPDVRVAKESASARAADADAAWGRVLPGFTARAGYTQNQVAAEAPLPGRTVVVYPLHQVDASLTLEAPLIDLAAWQRVGVAKAEARAAHATTAVMVLEAKKSTARHYYQLVAARALAMAAEHMLEAASANARVAAERRDAGRAPTVDVERAEAAVLRARQSVADAHYLEAVESRALASASSVTPHAGEASDHAMLDRELDDEGTLESWESRIDAPAVRAAAESTVVAERASSAARSVLVPVLSGFAQERFTNATGFTGRSALWSAGVTATWHFDAGTVATMRSASATARASTAAEDRARLEARDRVHDDWQLVRAAIAKSRAARAESHAAATSADLVAERYAAGTALELEVVQAERDAFTSQAARIQSDADLAYARMALRLDAGR
jgi:outer membrane protein TolC